MAIDYDSLVDRPRINGHVLTGDQSSEDLDIQGGSGNVDDVLVNGQSVVDEFKIAKIKSYKEVTQAEYNALPATKTEDDVMYCITDAHGADGYPPLIYSDEEREVGVWRDGKPLYQKTFSGALTPSSSYITVFSLATYDIDNLVSGEGYVKSSTMHYAGQIGASIDSGWSHLGWYITGGGDFQIYYPANESLDIFAVTVQYTKTTDTAGSGSWTTRGAYAHHYSTDEHVIGTWVDGKPIYEKTCLWIGLNISNTEYPLSTGITNAETLIGMRGSFKRSGSPEVWENLPVSHTNTAFMVSPNDFNTSNGTINLVVGSMNGMEVKDAYLTIQYTKTTD